VSALTPKADFRRDDWYVRYGLRADITALIGSDELPIQAFAAPEETITIATLLRGGWQIAGYTSTSDNRSAFILFWHSDEPYLGHAVKAMT
jgi:hypothetical protein